MALWGLLAWSCALLGTGCGKLETVPKFTGSRLGSAISAASRVVNSDSSYAIDVGTGYWQSNNDLSSSCTGVWNGGLAGEIGCMAPPALAYSNSRWFAGFHQAYLSDSTFTRGTALVNSTTSLLGGLFGTLGLTMTVIDQGSGLNGDLSSSSSRYVEFATLSNGDVVATYMGAISAVNAPAAGGVSGMLRAVFASVYNASSNSWSPTVLLSTANGGTTGNPTDRGVDFNSYLSHFCRPKVAASGSNAMVAWCEAPWNGAENVSQIYTATYSSGTWSTPAKLATVPDVAAYYATPGFTGAYMQLGATLSANPYYQAGVRSYIAANDVFSGAIELSATAVDVATVRIVDGTPSAGQARLVRDLSGNVSVCGTLQNVAQAMLAKQTYNATSLALTGYSFSQRGVSILTNTSCSDSDSTTWNLSLYWNRSLSNTIRDRAATTDHRIICLKVSADGGATLNSPTCTTYPTTAQDTWERSAAVDVAGDGYGNFALVRTLVSPYFQDNDITATGIGRGRMLVGHQYNSGTGWTRPSGITTGAAVSFVSRTPSCYNGTNHEACSVRHPKIVMSEQGKGLVLFYQKQFQPTGTAGSTNPNRLYWATYSTGTGYGTTANALDADTICNTTSTRNDTDVCETGSYASACQVVGEPVATEAISSITHDVPSIAARMNASGQGVVAYHKKVSTGSSASPSCGNVATFVVPYDPMNGFGDVTQVDSTEAASGNSMHAQVAISASGNIAVVWETAYAATRYVYLKIRKNGRWQSTRQVDASFASAEKSMMPSVGINETEVVVTYTYGAAGASSRRRQMARHFSY